MSYTKKAFNYVVQADNVDELHKGCQSKCYKSEGEDLPRKKIQKVQDTTNA
ncbi:37788_t:CDS:2, partial [Gigaspora margarita]